MKNIQLFDALRSLSKDEFRQFGKFVKSPYFNNRGEVCRFYEAVKKYYPDFTAVKIDVIKLFNKVYPGKKYNDVLMRKLFSLMLNLEMDFIAVKGFQSDKLDYNVKLIYNLYERKMPYATEKKAKLVEKLLSGSKHTYEYYEAKSKYTSWITAHRLNFNESSTIPKYQKELDDLVENFLAGILINYNRLITFSKMYNVKYDMKLFDEVMAFLKKSDYKDSALISLYYNLILLSKSGDEQYFEQLVKFRKKFENKLSDLEAHIIFVALYNYCINRKNTGDGKYNKIQFEITKDYFEKKKLPEQIGYIQSNLFSSAIINAAKLKEFKWIAEFLNKYSSLLDPQTANETINYCNSIIEFEKGCFEKSLKYLSVINPERIMRKIKVKNLAIMNFFELRYINELESAIDAYRHFIAVDSVSNESSKRSNKLFLKYISRLNNCRINENINEAELLTREAERSEYFLNKEWVLLKLDEIIKKGGK